MAAMAGGKRATVCWRMQPGPGGWQIERLRAAGRGAQIRGTPGWIRVARHRIWLAPSSEVLVEDSPAAAATGEAPGRRPSRCAGHDMLLLTQRQACLEGGVLNGVHDWFVALNNDLLDGSAPPGAEGESSGPWTHL